jgi:hypothetical protein
MTEEAGAESAAMPQYLTPAAQPGAAGPTTFGDRQALARQRKVAEAMMEPATSAATIGHWTQGLARIAQGGLGRLMARPGPDGRTSPGTWAASPMPR